MDIIGNWKIEEAKRFTMTDNGPKQIWQKAADIIADESIDSGEKQMLFADVVFTADGMVQWCLPIPEGATQEQIDEAIASGELKMSAGGKMIVEEKPWKEENGKIFYDTGAKGEVLGEAVSPWVEVPEEDGMIQLMVYKLKKV